MISKFQPNHSSLILSLPKTLSLLNMSPTAATLLLVIFKSRLAKCNWSYSSSYDDVECRQFKTSVKSILDGKECLLLSWGKVIWNHWGKKGMSIHVVWMDAKKEFFVSRIRVESNRFLWICKSIDESIWRTREISFGNRANGNNYMNFTSSKTKMNVEDSVETLY